MVNCLQSKNRQSTRFEKKTQNIPLHCKVQGCQYIWLHLYVGKTKPVYLTLSAAPWSLAHFSAVGYGLYYRCGDWGQRSERPGQTDAQWVLTNHYPALCTLCSPSDIYVLSALSVRVTGQAEIVGLSHHILFQHTSLFGMKAWLWNNDVNSNIPF